MSGVLLEQVREEINLICDSEGDRIQPGEVEKAIGYLLQIQLENCQFRDEIQEWLDRLRFEREEGVAKNSHE